MRKLPALLLLAGFLLAGGALGTPRQSPLRGPIADFWNQVKRDWARAIPGLRTGPDQTYQWISLVYGSPGENEAMDDLLEREMRAWASFMQRRWIRSMFWKKPFQRLDRESFYGSRAMRKNLVVMGTPATNPLVTEMTQGTPFSIDGETIRIGSREYTGSSLVLVFVRPNPLASGTYTLVLGSTHEGALLNLGGLTAASTDYILYRGTHAIESGYLDWSRPEELTLGGGRQTFPDHQGWETAMEPPVRVHFNPAELTEDQAMAFAAGRRDELRRLEQFFGDRSPPLVEEYLYGSLDEKMRHSSQPEPLSVDLAGGAVHRVWRPGDPAPGWPDAMVYLWSAWGVTDLQGLLYGLSLVPDGQLEGRSLREWAGHLAGRGWLQPMEELLGRREPPDFERPRKTLEILGVGSFLEQLADEQGLDRLRAFYQEANRGNYRRAFRERMGRSLSSADRSWRDGLEQDPIDPAPAQPADTPKSALLEEGWALFLDRQDRAATERLTEALEEDPSLAEAHLLLARIAFRGGQDEEAIAAADEALRWGGDDPDLNAWARVTLGRAHAMRGDLLAARLELTDASLSGRVQAPRILAEYWMENLGLSPDRAATARYLSQKAEVDLQRYDWEAAEARVLRILSADPGDVDAHHLLARIRLGKYRYWHDFTLLYNELFPSTDPSDPEAYFYLAQSAEREAAKGAYLESGRYTYLELDLMGTIEPPDGLGRTRDVILTSPRTSRGSMDPTTEHVLQAQNAYLAGDCRTVVSELEAALIIGVPVSSYRAGVLYLLGKCELELGDTTEGTAHLEEALHIAGRKKLKERIEAALNAD